jgi:hypothetical protein
MYSLCEFRENWHKNCWTFLTKLHLRAYRHVIESLMVKKDSVKSVYYMTKYALRSPDLITEMYLKDSSKI